mmetsp:Transcript_90541/g.235939  ORF Transcript_90541/g.235939 Transcript_90541/m.235939 type:complete len:213 (-) Transcript_90541:517-1155(-)
MQGPMLALPSAKSQAPLMPFAITFILTPSAFKLSTKHSARCKIMVWLALVEADRSPVKASTRQTHRSSRLSLSTCAILRMTGTTSGDNSGDCGRKARCVSLKISRMGTLGSTSQLDDRGNGCVPSSIKTVAHSMSLFDTLTMISELGEKFLTAFAMLSARSTATFELVRGTAIVAGRWPSSMAKAMAVATWFPCGDSTALWWANPKLWCAMM